jgi:hypothetical protein
MRDIGLIEDGIALGFLPKIDTKKLRRLEEERERRRAAGWAALHFAENAKKLGITLTKVQIAKVAKATREDKNA